MQGPFLTGAPTAADPFFIMILKTKMMPTHATDERETLENTGIHSQAIHTILNLQRIYNSVSILWRIEIPHRVNTSLNTSCVVMVC